MLRKKKAQLSPDEIEKILKKVGIQPTVQRMTLTRFLLCEADHISADEIKNWAKEKFPKVSLATIYNTLHVLVQKGLLQEFKFQHKKEVIYDSNTEKHFHLLNPETGELTDLAIHEVGIQCDFLEESDIQGFDLVIESTKALNLPLGEAPSYDNVIPFPSHNRRKVA